MLVVAAGAPKALYGFEPSELIGRPLAATIDVFGRWRHQFGGDESLLGVLAAQALEEAQGDSLGAGGKASAAGCAWRVGVHLPVKSDDAIVQHAAAIADGHGHSQVRMLNWSAGVRAVNCMFITEQHCSCC